MFEFIKAIKFIATVDFRCHNDNDKLFYFVIRKYQCSQTVACLCVHSCMQRLNKCSYRFSNCSMFVCSQLYAEIEQVFIQVLKL